uniref:Histone domain-containing protein n=1 Tax=Parastrongyloides trichosuri TaxID=131310 RepID=A0A0N4ZYH4_PARTI
MKKSKFSSKSKDQYKAYGDNYIPSSILTQAVGYGYSQENNINVANQAQPAISYSSGPIIEEVESEDENVVIEELSTSMIGTNINDESDYLFASHLLETPLAKSGPIASTAKRPSHVNGGDDLINFFGNNLDVSAIVRESPILSQQSNRGVIHYNSNDSSVTFTNSKSNSNSARGVTFALSENKLKRRTPSPINALNKKSKATESNVRGSRINYNSLNVISRSRSRHDSESSVDSEDIDYVSDNDSSSDDDEDDSDDSKEDEDDYESLHLGESELMEVRNEVNQFHKDIIQKNLKFIKKLDKDQNIRGNNRFSSEGSLQIPRAPFNRLVKEIGQNLTGRDCRFGKQALEILQLVSENFIIESFEMGNIIRQTCQRETLYPRDMLAARTVASRVKK